jgi:hypothetical protein
MERHSSLFTFIPVKKKVWGSAQPVGRADSTFIVTDRG